MRRFSIILFLVLLLSARDVPFVLAEDREIPQPSVTVVPHGVVQDWGCDGGGGLVGGGV